MSLSLYNSIHSFSESDPTGFGINSLIKLKDLDNSIIVVEHDRDMMLSADQIIDFGPGAGEHGGKIIAQGSPADLKNCESLTCQYLSGKKKFTPKETYFLMH